MIFRQLFDVQTSTFTYLLADKHTRDAILIDTVFEQHQRDLALIRELDLNLIYTLETHIHADHVTGAWLLKQATGSQIALASVAGAEGCDLALKQGDYLSLGDIIIEIRATPGHTDGCLSFVVLDHKMVFTGDALLIRGAGRTDFQQGNPSQLYQSIHKQLFSLPEDFILYPGHDYNGRCASTIGEELKYNPRLGGDVREQDFIVYMQNLGLPHPKLLDIAVPANMKCGRPEKTIPHPDWAPVIRTYAGILEVNPEWVFQQRHQLCLIDVREEDEVKNSTMGVISDSISMPLSTLRDHGAHLSQDKPIITICPAGARSAMAASIIERSGIDRVANMRGGIIEWMRMGLPTAPRE
jgi:glyoxylase-like metal-dependent hydrolase (beta-lactamase superfamily II)/rhodanese-related sulfurtransferase